jgi:hypothetical protein
VVRLAEDEGPAQAVKEHARAVRPTANHVVLLTGRPPPGGNRWPPTGRPRTPEPNSTRSRHSDGRPAPLDDSTARAVRDPSARPSPVVTVPPTGTHLALRLRTEPRKSALPSPTTRSSRPAIRPKELSMVGQMILMARHRRPGGDAQWEPVIWAAQGTNARLSRDRIRIPPRD